MVKPKIDFTPESKKLISDLLRAGKVDLRGSFNTIAVGYRKEVKAIFNKQQPRAQGERWQPLNDNYKRYKDLRYPGTGILERTGALKRSMTQKGAIGNITFISSIKAIFGSSLSYGVYHDEGTSKTPQRNFSIPSDRRLDIFKNNIEDDIIKQLRFQGIEVKKGLFV